MLCYIHRIPMYRNSMLKGGLYMNIQKELSKGSSSLLVLSVLGTGDMYGYQIIKEIEQRQRICVLVQGGHALSDTPRLRAGGTREVLLAGRRARQKAKILSHHRQRAKCSTNRPRTAFVFERSRKGDKERVSALGSLRR